MRALNVYEAINFRRGQDPKTALNIGLTAKRNFDTIDELVEWMFRFPEIFSEGKIREWDYKTERKKYGHEYYVIRYPQLRGNMPEYVKWIKRNIQRDGMDWGLKESKDAFDSLERFLVDRSEKGVHESVSFQRGQDPMDSLQLGTFQRRVLKKIKLLIKENWPDAEFIDEKISVGLEYCNTFFLQIKLKVSIKDINANNSLGGPTSLSLFTKDLEDQMDELELEIWDLSLDKKNFWQWRRPDILNIEILNRDAVKIHYEESLDTPQKRPAGLVAESVDFKRGQDPKSSMGIGLLDLFIERLKKAGLIRIRFYNYVGMPGGQFTVPKGSLPGWKPWQEEMKDIFGEEYIQRVGDGWPQDWYFAEIRPKYVDIYKEAWERVFRR